MPGKGLGFCSDADKRNDSMRWITLLALLTLAGCSGKQLSDEDFFKKLEAASEGAVAEYKRSTFDEVREAYQTGLELRLSLYTPSSWAHFNQQLREASRKDAEGQHQDCEDIASQALAMFDKMTANRALIASALSEPVAMLAKLDEIKADKVLPGEYAELTEEFEELSYDLESRLMSEGLGTDESGKVLVPGPLHKDHQKLIAGLDQLQQETLLALHWQPAQRVLDKIKMQNLDKLAPRSYQEALDLTNAAKQQISESYKTPDTCKALGDSALKAAQHALYVGREVRKILNLDERSAEGKILKFEGYLHQIAEALEAGDQRNMALIDQTISLVQKAQQMRDRIEQPLRDEIETLRIQLNSLQAQLEHKQRSGQQISSYE